MLTLGDGTFLYNPIVQALTASRQMALPILIVIFNNRKYLSMQLNHLRFYPDGQSVEAGMFHGVDLADQPDLEALAAPCGAKGIAVRDKAALDAAIAEAIATVQGGQTCVLNLQVNR
jgi:acetolactate synthase-1/2/3 large subunit